MLDCVDKLSTPLVAAAAAAAMCSGLDVTDTTHDRSGSTTDINEKNSSHDKLKYLILKTKCVLTTL